MDFRVAYGYDMVVLESEHLLDFPLCLELCSEPLYSAGKRAYIRCTWNPATNLFLSVPLCFLSSVNVLC